MFFGIPVSILSMKVKREWSNWVIFEDKPTNNYMNEEVSEALINGY